MKLQSQISIVCSNPNGIIIYCNKITNVVKMGVGVAGFF